MYPFRFTGGKRAWAGDRDGLFSLSETIEDTQVRVVAETGLGGGWYLRDFVNSPDPRYRALVKRFAEAGY